MDDEREKTNGSKRQIHSRHANVAAMPSQPSAAEAAESSNTSRLVKRVDDLTQTMHSNLQSILKRGHTLHDLEHKVGTVELGSKQFMRTADKVDKRLWWKENRWKVLAYWALGILIVALLIYFYITRVLED